MCTHAGFGLFIGYTTLAMYSIVLIFAIGILADKKLINEVIQEITSNEAEMNAYATTVGFRLLIVFILVVGVIMAIVSAVLIKGIQKKRPVYLMPWLLITFIIIAGSFIYNFVVLLTSDSPAVEFILGMTAVVVQCAIFYPIYTLYRGMRVDKFPPPPATL